MKGLVLANCSNLVIQSDLLKSESLAGFPQALGLPIKTYAGS